jgi:hypothetical protein
MDRDELEERLRARRPGDVGFRRGATPEDAAGETRPQGYVPFAPEPEDVLAAHDEEAVEAPRVDHLPDEPPPAAPEPWAEPAPAAWDRQQAGEQPYAEQPYAEQPYPAREPYLDEPYTDAEPYGPPAAYAQPYRDDRGGGGALPIIGFVALCVLALGVGAVLAGLFTGPDGVADASPTPSVASVAPTVAPTVVPTVQPSGDGGSATPEPTDGPVTFADGAVISVQPCATNEMSFDGCGVDGSSIDGDRVWVWIGFDDARGTDTFTLTLQSNGQTIDQQEKQLGSVLDCPGTCSGYLIGAAYRDLQAGDYALVVRRNGDFADRATFSVGG